MDSEDSSNLHIFDCKHPNDPNYRRLLFVRYADDFILGVIGPKLLAIRVQDFIG